MPSIFTILQFLNPGGDPELGDSLHICLSNPDEPRTCPSGENLQVKISPSWPVNSMMGACRLDVLGGP